MQTHLTNWLCALRPLSSHNNNNKNKKKLWLIQSHIKKGRKKITHYFVAVIKSSFFFLSIFLFFSSDQLFNIAKSICSQHKVQLGFQFSRIYWFFFVFIFISISISAFIYVSLSVHFTPFSIHYGFVISLFIVGLTWAIGSSSTTLKRPTYVVHTKYHLNHLFSFWFGVSPLIKKIGGPQVKRPFNKQTSNKRGIELHIQDIMIR